MKTIEIKLSHSDNNGAIVPFLVSSDGINYSVYNAFDGFSITQSGLYFKLKSLELEKDDLVLSVFLKIISKNAYSNCLHATKTNNSTLDYSTNGFNQRSFLFDITKAYSNSQNDEPIIIIKSLESNPISFYGDKHSNLNDYSSDTAALIINYVPKDAFGIRNKEIPGSLGKSVNYSINPANARFQLTKSLFEQFLPYDFSLNFSSYGDEIISFFPKHWNISLIEKIELDGSNIIYTNSLLRKRIFKPVENDYSVFYDSTGTGMVIKIINDDYYLYPNLHNQLTYKVFSHYDGMISSIVLGYGKYVSFDYYSDLIIISDNYSNSISISKNYNNDSIEIELSNNSVPIDLSYVLSLDYNNVYEFYYLTSITKIVDNQNVEIDTIIPYYDKIQRLTTQTGDSVLLTYDENDKTDLIQQQVIKNGITKTIDSLAFNYGYLSTKVDAYHGISTVYNFDEDLNVVDECLYQDGMESISIFDELLGQDKTLHSMRYRNYIGFNESSLIHSESTISSYNSIGIGTLGVLCGGYTNEYVFKEALLRIDISCGNSLPLPSKGKRKICLDGFNAYPTYRGIIVTILFTDYYGSIYQNLTKRYYFDVENNSSIKFVHIKMPYEARFFKITIDNNYLNSAITINSAVVYELNNVYKSLVTDSFGGYSIDNTTWTESLLFTHNNEWMSISDIYENQIIHKLGLSYQWYKNKTKLVKMVSVSNLLYNWVPYNNYLNNSVTLSNNDLLSYASLNNFAAICSSILNNYSFLSDDKCYGIDARIKNSLCYFNYLITNTSNYESAFIKHHSVASVAPLEEKVSSVYSYNDEKLKDIDSNGIITENVINSSTGNVDYTRRYSENNQSLLFETEYDYDGFDRVTSKYYQASTSIVEEEYRYVGTSLLVESIIPPLNHEIKYEYENYSNLVKVTVYDSSLFNKSIESTYDNGFLSSITNGGNHYIYEYDGYNLVNRIKLDDGSNNNINGISPLNPLDPIEPISGGDSPNVIIPPEDPNPNDDDYLILINNSISAVGNHFTVSYINGDTIQKYYDKYNRLESVRYFVNSSMTSAIYTYDDYPVTHEHNVSAISRLVNIEDEFSGIDLEYEYDDYSLRLNNINYKDGNTTHHTISYVYDGIGRTSEINISMFNETYKNTFSYHKLSNNVTSITASLNNSGSYKINELIEMDLYKRITRITNKCNDSNFTCIKRQFSYYPNTLPLTNQLTNIVSSIDYLQGMITLYSESFEYDNEGKITKITQSNNYSTVSKRYIYDSYGKLRRENNQETGYSKTYRYDSNGNINRVQIGNYSTSTSVNLTNPTVTNTFVYDSTYKDKLISVDGVSILYDDNLNPISYGNNILMTWERGRLLSTYSNSSTGLSISFEYNHEGIRTKKTVTINNSTTTHEYYLNGKSIVGEGIGTTKLIYLYGVTGVVGIIKKVNSSKTIYYFNKNIFGDITEIYQANGTLVNKYVYDAYGLIQVKKADGTIDSDMDSIGNLNPFRYRGYYFDRETHLYYCQSRYYYPEWRRWINLDSLSYLNNKSIYDSNLFAYCDNNPIMFKDETGNMAVSTALLLVGIGVGAVIGAATNVASQYIANGGWDNFNWASLGWNTLIGAASGALSVSSLGLGAMVVANAALGTVGSIGNHLINGDNFASLVTWADVGLSTGFGALAGLLGGAGIMSESNFNDVRATLNVFKASSSYFSVLNKVANGSYVYLKGAYGAINLTKMNLIKAWNHAFSRIAWTSLCKSLAASLYSNTSYAIIGGIIETEY